MTPRSPTTRPRSSRTAGNASTTTSTPSIPSRSPGIVSSNQQATLEHHLAHAEIDHLFHAVHGREPHPDSIRKKKPNPHYVHEALDALDADTALYVGDRDSDVQAAHNAGIDSAYIHRDHNDGATTDPTYELESLHGLPDILS